MLTTAYLLVDSHYALFFKQPGPIAPYKHYRFTNLVGRDGLPPQHPGIDSFGFLSAEKGGYSRNDECKSFALLGPRASYNTSENMMILSLEGPGDSMHALWYIVTSKEEGSESKDSVSIWPSKSASRGAA